MDNVEVIKPPVIEELPLPITSGNITLVRQPQSSSDPSTQKPPVENENTVPPKIIAHETISNTLNTQEKRILGEYQFGKMGAIKIGEYQQGVQGEISISPNGIVAKNQSNQTTFSLDADTGDATFRGEIMANSLVSGLVSVGQTGTSAGVFIDGENKRIIVHDGTNPRIIIGNL